MTETNTSLTAPVTSVMRSDVSALPLNYTVQEALSYIRQKKLGEKIIYFYVVDQTGCLKGVLPVRKLLTAPLDTPLETIMVPRVIAIPADATVLDACELFLVHRFLALPVVDNQGHLIGIVDITVFTDEVFDIAERSQIDSLFESIGIRITQLKSASPTKAAGLRFPWLLVTVSSGLICALISQRFESTFIKATTLGFFITLVLGLGESVAAQSMSIAIHLLRHAKPNLSWTIQSLKRELTSGIILGISIALLISFFAASWFGFTPAIKALSVSIPIVIINGCLVGLFIPSLLHKLQLDLKVASGPLVLGIADICTVTTYFTLASLLVK